MFCPMTRNVSLSVCVGTQGYTVPESSVWPDKNLDHQISDLHLRFQASLCLERLYTADSYHQFTREWGQLKAICQPYPKLFSLSTEQYFTTTLETAWPNTRLLLSGWCCISKCGTLVSITLAKTLQTLDSSCIDSTLSWWFVSFL